MGKNGRQRPPRPRIEIRQSSASPEEAAAIAAAIEQFIRDSAPPRPTDRPPRSQWLRAAMLEGAGLDPAGAEPWWSP